METKKRIRREGALQPYGALADCAREIGVSAQTVANMVKSGFRKGNAEKVAKLRAYIKRMRYYPAKEWEGGKE